MGGMRSWPLAECLSTIVLLNFLLTVCSGELNDCYGKSDCSQCISVASSPCTWCKDPVYRLSERSYYQRCDKKENHVQQGCKSITDPPSSARIESEAPLVGETRVSPQSVSVKLRPGQPATVTVKVKTPVNFPIDLYYLMDLSKSMEDDLQQIRGIGSLLANEMSSVTTNFRLGFGAFVDKPVNPYTQVNPGTIQTFLAGGDIQYTFDYRNYLPLSEDPQKFEETLKNIKISFNVDSPEDSLDALLQVVVCEKEIGWRDKKKARRIVIITTDATFHYAGDGLLGGFVKPNDGRCYLSRDGLYTAWDKFDYPSLSQIKSIMVDNQIIPIFATTNNTELYTKVAQFFGDASGAVASTLKADSSNVVPLIKEAYEQIAKIVSISSSAPPGVNVNFFAQCKEDGEMKRRDFCDNVAIGDQVTFNVTIATDSCSINGLSSVSFKIKTNFDDVDVKLDLVCACECSNSSLHEANSTYCNGSGSLVCGQCACPLDRAGRFCQCHGVGKDDPELCRLAGTVGPVCSGIGTCECGECLCPAPQVNEFNEVELSYGVDCECSNTTCGRSNGGKLCGGSGRGRCDCGVCVCEPDWTGPTCADECLKTTAACFRDELECSGKGRCICGRCQCMAGYIGDLCQECVTNCPDPCIDYRECVRCDVFETSKLSREECRKECARWNITKSRVVDKVPEEKRCISRDEDDCSFVFTYKKDNITGQVELIVQSERICPAEPDILAIILGVIAGIVGIGLALLLIWKLLATIQDRREFAKFEKDRQNAKWDTAENPIFQQATSTFQNPTYGGQATS